MKYLATVNEKAYTIEITPDGEVLVDGEARMIDFQALEEGTAFSLLIDNVSHEGLVDERMGQAHVLLRGTGTLYDVRVMDEREQRLSSERSGLIPDAGEIPIIAPMPGLVIKVPVTPGEEVEAGQTLVILESMKMENELKAPRAGMVGHVNVREGESVEQNKVLVTLT